MTEQEPLIREDRDGVAWLTMNRPHALNALDRTLVQAMHGAFLDVERDPGVRAVVLTGAGRAFNAGADMSLLNRLAESGEAPGDEVADAMEYEFNPMMRAMYAVSKPMIAAVNGPAAGGGASIALSCDIVLAARSAYFQLTFGPNLGIVPDIGGSWLFARAGSRARGLGMALTADRLSAPDAAAAGLIWRCTPDDLLTETAGRMASKLAKGPTRAYQMIKEAMRLQAGSSLYEQLALEARLQREAGKTADFAEGVAAFLEGRPAAFRGR
ncbi:MAG: enoyl-CoA hydratase-related protein [Minwuia sp.]|uniref:enoyl-CoA hydratase-related protein n=1 Tax=Minwuia sp. TaxID=2493630 RepID=UPI003A84748C